MRSGALDLEHELASLDPELVQVMLRVVKAKQQTVTHLPFTTRIAKHSAIGTWPENMDADQQIEQLRAEWE